MTFRVLSRVRVPVLLFLVAAPLLAQAPPAPTPAPAPAVTPRPGVVAAEEVTVLTLDVVAVDSKERPVFGLVAADFEVRVAGKVQTIDFFEPPRGVPAKGTGTPTDGRPDSEERIAGTTTPFDPKGATRHVLVWVDLEQLPRRTIIDTAAALHKAFDHAPSGRYGFVTHLGGTSSRVWDADSVEAFLMEADRMSDDATAEGTTAAAVQSPGTRRMSGGRGADSPVVYETRKAYEQQLIDDLIWAEQGQGDTRPYVLAISDYLVAERQRVKRSVEDLKESAGRLAALEGPRHLFLVSEGFERVPGFNFLARLKAEESARVRAAAGVGDASSPLGSRGRAGGSAFPANPNAPGAAQSLGSNRFVFDPSPLMDADELGRWLASSGVTLHFIDPGSLGRELPSAADKYAFESTLRKDDARNLQEAPLSYALATGGLTRTQTNDVAGVLEGFLDATSATYRIGVRLQGVDPKKTYSIKVATRKPGVNMYARSAFRKAAPAPVAVANLSEEARRAGVAARADERRPGAGRAAKKPIPVTLEWRGRASTPSPDPAKPFWKLEVRIPHEDLKFDTESDAFVASVKIAVEAAAVDGVLKDSTADDWFLSYTGDEYKEARDGPAVRLVTLQLPPGRYDLRVSVNDALAGTYGQATLRVEAR